MAIASCVWTPPISLLAIASCVWTPPISLRPPLPSGFSRDNVRTGCSGGPPPATSVLKVRPRRMVVAVSSRGGNSEEESFGFGGNKSSSQEASFDIKLPRRNLIVKFTCDACGERTQRTVNRVAYERGTIFVQCAGCLVNHKLVDNLGLVVEYDLRKENDADHDDISI